VTPPDPSALLAEGLAAQKSGRLRRAEECYRAILKENPAHADALHLLGTIAFQAGKPADAVTLIRRAISLNPADPHYHNNCGPALRVLDRFNEAAASYRECLRLAPDHPEAWYNLGKTFAEAARPAEALDAYNRQLALNPQHLSARWNRSLALLQMGNYRYGWREYEIRWEATPFKRRAFPQPPWRGEPLDSKTLLIHAEQGLGDTIQMLRYAPLAAERGARVILECQPELAALARTVQGLAAVIPRGNPLPDFDFEIPAMSLPLAFQTTLETIPNKIPYLRADPDQSSFWKARLENIPARRKIGLVWAGGEKHPANSKRSMSPQLLAPLAAIPDTVWISLQKGQPAAPFLFPLHDWTSELHDFAHTAALVRNLDAVITVDTAVAHLAGALGKPVWILLPFSPDFRWLMERTDSPWYPTARLLRQTSPSDWKGTVDHLCLELEGSA
jgi:hypothetical protein